jgi:hypothetical protein
MKLSDLDKSPLLPFLTLALVWFGLALGHSAVVIQAHYTGGVSVPDTLLSAVQAVAGIVLVWMGLNRNETQATILGYLGGNLIWLGVFEWTWHYFGHWLAIEPVMDRGMPILMPGLLMIQSTSILVILLLIFMGANKDTRCRMFMWFHRNLKLRPGRMTPGYQRQHSRTTATEVIFLIWFIYLCAITINDPRLIRYDSTAAMVITVGFVIWGLYLINKLRAVRGVGPSLRYAIASGSVMWLPIEAFSRWGLYPEIWIKPLKYAPAMMVVAAGFIVLAVTFYRSGSDPAETMQPHTEAA